MNTVAIGDNFESKALSIIKKVIEEEQLGHLGKHIRIFTKNDKGYYSQKRKKEIYFDLTIEVWPPGATKYVVIYIIECKDYQKRVPVDDIEEFHSKILQVSGVNVKGIFITNSLLQVGAYNYAESVGMMVIQGESAENYNIILHKNSRGSGIEKIPFIEETKDLGLIDYGVYLLEKVIDKKIIAIFKQDLLQNRVAYNLDKLSKYNIENLANSELDKINPNILKQGFALSPKPLYKFLQENQKISIIEIDSNSRTLGSCDIKNSTIGINKIIKNTNRELFILAHEYGHFTLHQKLLIGQELYDNFIDSEYNFRTAKHELTNPKHWIEWQANYFASSLVLPKAPFLAIVWKCQNILGMSNGKIFLDDQYQNRNKFIELVKRLSYLFNVSKTTVIYKLSELELINEQSRLKSIGQIINEYRDGLFT